MKAEAGPGGDPAPQDGDLAPLRAVAEGTAAAFGEEFFPSLVRHLAAALGVAHASSPSSRAPAPWPTGPATASRPTSSSTWPAPPARRSSAANSAPPGRRRGQVPPRPPAGPAGHGGDPQPA